MSAFSQRYAPKVLHKYLTRYAEPDAGIADQLGRYERGLVVPVFREAPEFLNGFRRALGAASGRTLCVLVVNEPSDATTQDRRKNADLLQILTRGGTPLTATPPAFLVPKESHDLLVVARTDRAFSIPRAHGVGLARKIGADILTRAFFLGRVHSPWLFVTDADATLPRDYFGTVPAPDSSALCFPFRHVQSGDDDVLLATLAYEVELRYRVLGLWHAGCPYAFHTIGSCIAVHAESYAAVRGFPMRAAGEDFHLLRKLAKLGPVEIPRGDPLLLSARLSDRVPFGTGPSVARLCAGQPHLLDDPRCYDALRDAIAAVLESATGAQDVARRLERCDSLYCQRLLHGFRRHRHAELPAPQAIAAAPFVPPRVKTHAADVPRLVTELEALEALLPTRRGPTLVTAQWVAR